MNDDRCACGRTGCYVSKSNWDTGGITIDGKEYRTICGIGLLWKSHEALKFYAQESNWQRKPEGYREPAVSFVEKDRGERARVALNNKSWIKHLLEKAKQAAGVNSDDVASR